MVMIDDLRSRFFVVAHRGASAYEPENTLRSIRRAIEIGADVVEIDVRVTRDGYPIVIHDETVDRTTDGSGLVNEFSLDGLRKLDAGEGERIPLLGEVLDLVADKINIFIEIKVDEAVLPSLKEVDVRDLWSSVMFTSFNIEHLRRVLEFNPEANVGLVYIRPVDGIVGAKKLGAIAVLPFYRLATRKAIAFAKRLKLMVIPWTIDDLNVARKLKVDGANGIVTNKPDIMLELK
ncbi:MAG: glycerophosphodiester phosphodiesterase [archaeon GB-1867-035]|nr:glycerophosphodiester phosphodiesterase [Candidatus Culexmicrobium profundum]